LRSHASLDEPDDRRGRALAGGRVRPDVALRACVRRSAEHRDPA